MVLKIQTLQRVKSEESVSFSSLTISLPASLPRDPLLIVNIQIFYAHVSNDLF